MNSSNIWIETTRCEVNTTDSAIWLTVSYRWSCYGRNDGPFLDSQPICHFVIKDDGKISKIRQGLK